MQTRELAAQQSTGSHPSHNAREVNSVHAKHHNRHAASDTSSCVIWIIQCSMMEHNPFDPKTVTQGVVMHTGTSKVGTRPAPSIGQAAGGGKKHHQTQAAAWRHLRQRRTLPDAIECKTPLHASQSDHPCIHPSNIKTPAGLKITDDS